MNKDKSKDSPAVGPCRVHLIRHSALDTRQSGFTLTEILIALALISFLLVGISRIFALTSTTISKGQGVSTALRTHKAIAQTLSTDFLGYSSSGNIDKSDDKSGMAPLVVDDGESNAAPFFQISNFRIATYLNKKDYDSALNPPALTVSNLTTARSTAIRTVLNSDGTTTRVIPLYEYGLRNFRTDTLGFFGKGQFRTQTGSLSSTTYMDDGVTSESSYIHYGHLRIFDSNAASLGFSRGHGHPGSFLTPTSTPEVNQNNRFAEQFALGRFQFLLVEPSDYYGTASAGSGNNTEYNYKTIVASSDVTKPVFFARRNWDFATYLDPANPPTATNNRPTLTPLNFSSTIFSYSSGINRSVDINDVVGGPAATKTQVFSARTDVMGAGLSELRQRAEFMVETDSTTPPSNGFRWYTFLPCTWTDRFIVNPYPAMTNTSGTLNFNARTMGQRQQLLADSASQFIVEYAGDFLTQNPATGAPAGNVPDGIIDFVVDNNVKQTRWYGMPRDVDGDGRIPGPGNNARLSSPDVIPLCDFAGARTAPGGPFPSAFEFEKVVPPPLSSGANSNYMSVIAEPVATFDPDDTSYVCVWGPNEFKNGTVVGTKTAYSVPQLVRIIVEISDPKGRLGEPATQEYVFPVKVSE